MGLVVVTVEKGRVWSAATGMWYPPWAAAPSCSGQVTGFQSEQKDLAFSALQETPKQTPALPQPGQGKHNSQLRAPSAPLPFRPPRKALPSFSFSPQKVHSRWDRTSWFFLRPSRLYLAPSYLPSCHRPHRAPSKLSLISAASSPVPPAALGVLSPSSHCTPGGS